MDKSRCEELVSKHLWLLLEFMAVNHWKCYHRCDRLKRRRRAEVEIDIDYMTAHFTFDHDKFDHDDELIDSMFHEVSHLVIAPMYEYIETMSAHIKEGTRIAEIHHSLQRRAEERGVVALESIWGFHLRKSYLAFFEGKTKEPDTVKPEG